MRGPRGPKGPYSEETTETEEEPHNTFYGEVHTASPDYQSLPQCIKASVTAKDYLWMGDYARQRLIKDMTEPEGTED